MPGRARSPDRGQRSPAREEPGDDDAGVASTITAIAARRSTVSATHPSSGGDQTKPV